MKRKRKIVVTDFYADGKCVWRAESPEILTDDRIKQEIKRIAEYGYGVVEAITDSSGRLIRF